MDKIQEQVWFFTSKGLIVISVLVIGYILIRVLTDLIKKLLKKTKLDHTASSFLVSVIRVMLYFITVITALGTIGVNVASMITALGAAALTAGLALQDCLNNIVSGLVILINKPFVAGDLLEFEKIRGRVETIRIFSTTLHTLDNKLVVVPNSQLTKNNVINCTMTDGRRLDLKYTISYEDNIAKTKEVIYSVIAKNEKIYTTPNPEVHIGEHLDNGLEVLVYVWVDPDNFYEVYYYMQENVKIAFDENSITIPYPHLVVKK